MSDYPTTYEIQFASVALSFDYLQFDPKIKQHRWHLSANVTFRSVTIPGTSIGDIEVGVSKSTIAVELEKCKFDPFQVGYQRIAEQQRTNNHDTQRTTVTNFEGNLGAGLDANADASDRAKANVNVNVNANLKLSRKKSSIDEITKQEHKAWDKSEHLITHTFMRADHKYSEWRIESIDSTSLTSTVIALADNESGVLGELHSSTDGGFSAKPIIEFTPSAQIIENKEELGLINKIRISMTASNRNKLGVVGALLKKKLVHTGFGPFDQEEFK